MSEVSKIEKKSEKSENPKIEEEIIDIILHTVVS